MDVEPSDTLALKKRGGFRLSDRKRKIFVMGKREKKGTGEKKRRILKGRGRVFNEGEKWKKKKKQDNVSAIRGQ